MSAVCGKAEAGSKRRTFALDAIARLHEIGAVYQDRNLTAQLLARIEGRTSLRRSVGMLLTEALRESVSSSHSVAT